MAGTAPALFLAFAVSSASPPCEVAPEAPLPKATRTEGAVERRATATPPGTSLTLAWLLTQLLPSPELALGEDGAAAGLRWQVVPVLYSFGIDRRLSPFRVFVVEPLVRTSGSVELFVAPEYLWIERRVAERFGFRTGLRAHFPLLDLAILPIAPIHPREFMCRAHIDPSEAIQAFLELRAQRLLPMHYDTFVNSFDELGEAPRELERAATASGVRERLVLLRVGEQRVLERVGH